MTQAKNAIRLSASAYLVVNSAIIIFGRNVPAIWQGMVGLIASLEGNFGAESGNPRRVLLFLVLLVPLVALSVTMGVLVLAGKGDSWLVNCNSHAATQDLFNATTSEILIECGTSYVVFGFVELCGGGGVGFVIFFIVYFSLRKLKLEAAENEAKLADMETLIAA